MHYDIAIIGTGAGGGTLLHALAGRGKRILVLERGDYVPREKANWNTRAVNVEGRYQTKETWRDRERRPLHPHTNYYVGGNTKFYGAALFRLRREDFGEIKHWGGISPAWPIEYEDLEPYYTAAERLYHVHGERGADPTDPPASAPYPHPPVSHEPRIQRLHDDWARLGLRPFHVPLGIMLDEADPRGSRCIRCETCDGHPWLVGATSDDNPAVFPKPLRLNDFYCGSHDWEYPMGHVSFVGKLDADTLRGGAPAIAPGWSLDLMAKHSMDFWLTSEDLPDPDNRVTLDRDGNIVLAYRPNNETAHERLTAKLEQLMKQQTKCGVHGHECHEGLFSRNLFLGQRIPLAGVAHQNGTARFGHDPRASVLDVNCRAHEVDNLYVVYASFFPSSATGTPALTIMANALRVADHLKSRLGI